MNWNNYNTEVITQISERMRGDISIDENCTAAQGPITRLT